MCSVFVPPSFLVNSLVRFQSESRSVRGGSLEVRTRLGRILLLRNRSGTKTGMAVDVAAAAAVILAATVLVDMDLAVAAVLTMVMEATKACVSV